MTRTERRLIVMLDRAASAIDEEVYASADSKHPTIARHARIARDARRLINRIEHHRQPKETSLNLQASPAEKENE